MTTSSTRVPAQPARTAIDLDIQGMTCASCAARIEKKLNKVDGVQASVNYATEKAHVLAPGGTSASELIRVVENAGYGAAEPTLDATPVDHARALRSRLVVAAVLSVPVLLTSMVPALQFAGWQWVDLVLATAVVFWCGLAFHRSALVNLRHRATTMDTLVSLGTLTAWAWSAWAMLLGHAGMIGMKHHFSLRPVQADPTSYVYFEAACGIITFLLLGRWIEARSRREAGSALAALLAMGVDEVTVVHADGASRTIPIAALQVGQVFRVAPGEKVATDGVVAEGRSAVDASLVTGESMPVEVGPGDALVGGSVNTTGVLLVRASAVGTDTQLARIAHLVESAQTGKANAQRLADKVSSVFVPVVLGLSLLTLIGWLVAGRGWGFALSAAIAVLIIACPCALGLATPTALLAGTGRGAELGILISGPEALERARRITTVLVDKTGTLTTGRMALAGVQPAAGQHRAELDGVLASLEQGSLHPVARAIVAGLPDADLVRVSDVTEIPGRGVRGELPDGTPVFAGTARLLADEGIGVPVSLADAATRGADAGSSPVLVAWGGRTRGLALVSDTPKPDAVAALRQLKGLGLRLVMVTGDTPAAAEHLAAQLTAPDGTGLLDAVAAGVLPEQKAAEVTGRQALGERVAMIGDGVNDAGALAAADLGIALGEGTDAARAASDITLLHHDLGLAAEAVRLSRRTLSTIHGNLFWAMVYNAAAIPLAALGFLTPMIAGAAMASSSVFVVLNSLRLKAFRASRSAG